MPTSFNPSRIRRNNLGNRINSLFFMQVCLLCTSITLPFNVIATEYVTQDYGIFDYSKDQKKLKKYVKQLQSAYDKGEEEFFNCLGKIIHFCEKRFQVKFSCDKLFLFLEEEGFYIPVEWREIFKDHYRYYIKRKKAEIEFYSLSCLSSIYDRDTKETFISHWLKAQGIEEPKDDLPLGVIFGVTECMAGGFMMFCGCFGAVFGPWSVTLWGMGVGIAMDGVSRLTSEYIDQQEEYDFTDV